MDGKWGTAPLPARDASQPIGVGMAGGSSIVIFKASKHKEAARKFIEFLSETGQQVRFSELTGDLPARRSAWKAPALANDPYLPAFREQLERVEPLPKVPEWEEIATAIYEHGEAAVKGAMPVPAALADLDRVTDGLLEKRRWIRAHTPSPSRTGEKVPQADEGVSLASGTTPHPPAAPSPRKRGEGGGA